MWFASLLSLTPRLSREQRRLDFAGRARYARGIQAVVRPIRHEGSDTSRWTWEQTKAL